MHVPRSESLVYVCMSCSVALMYVDLKRFHDSIITIIYINFVLLETLALCDRRGFVWLAIGLLRQL